MIKYLPFLLVASLITCCVEVDISIPSFPDISDYFAISDGLTQLTIAANFFGFCLSSAVYGPLSDAFGRRVVMLIGNVIMLVGACGCVIADSIELLLLARFVQGIGASTSAVVAFAMVADSYSAEKAASLIGTMNSLITIFMSVAPIAGGFLNETVGWRGSYTTIAVLSVVSWIALYFWLPETKKHFDKFSSGKMLQDYKILLTDSRFMYASLVPSLSFSGWMSFVSCSSFLYMETYDLPIMYYALHQGAVLGVFSISSHYCGRISRLIGEKNCVRYGNMIMVMGGVSMVIIAIVADRSPYLTTISMLLYSFGAAIIYPIIFVKSLEIFPEISGTASSAIMAMRALICAISIAITAYFYHGELITVAYMVLGGASLVAVLSIRLLKLVQFATKRDVAIITQKI